MAVFIGLRTLFRELFSYAHNAQTFIFIQSLGFFQQGCMSLDEELLSYVHITEIFSYL
jgi:hypothetical protein